MNLVLDCSVTMAWCFEDEANAYSKRIQRFLESDDEAVVPSIWPIEVANVFWIAERRKRSTVAQTTAMIQLLNSLEIKVDPEMKTRTWRDTLQIARTCDITAYDAAYLELAIRSGLPLATQDKIQKIAARACGVEIV